MPTKKKTLSRRLNGRTVEISFESREELVEGLTPEEKAAIDRWLSERGGESDDREEPAERPGKPSVRARTAKPRRPGQSVAESSVDLFTGSLFDDLPGESVLASAETPQEPAATPRTPGTPADAKYVGPNGETWTGRGRRPAWLRELLAAGHGLEEFLRKDA
ncbi:H-NS family nucleoid-associated regulatory protein [Sutterella sp.]|uniref:H-NS family nucleoid-associated regulatory protein n=1 Tax=Sutterella sp. TaxID=1981025 RepID=UPI0026DF58FD|nr:H-NS family nucleoid-associated regulatory protein [Sutterella sp.]MDO5532414.1 H-NS family nucleoid-associated regulatory protein [Sutterella sp.]